MVVNLLALALLSQTLPLAPEGRVYLRTYEGTVEVSGWDRAEVRIDSRIESRAFVRIAACDAKPRLSVDAWPASVRITTVFGDPRDAPPWWLAACNGRPLVHYRIWVPRGAALTIVAEASRIRVTGVARVYLKSHATVAAGGARE